MFSGLFMYLIFLIIGFASGAFKKVSNQCKTKGIVVSLEQKHKSRKKRITHTAVVSYVVQGKTYNIRTSYQSSFFALGKRIIVCYDANNPQNSFVKTGIMVYILMFASIIVGTIFIFNEIVDLLI